MSLLNEIIEAAVDSRSDLGAMLRNCKVLASRLGSAPLEEWLKFESNGYPDGAEVPDYRRWGIELRGTFHGLGGRTMKNALIPRHVVPEHFRTTVTDFSCRESVSAIESLLSDGHAGHVYISVGDLPVFLGDGVYVGMNCVEARGQFAKGNLIEVLNTVRNRVLDFALALQKEAPEAGDAAGSSPIESSRVTQIFYVEALHGDINAMRDQFNAGQAAAMGPNAHAHDNTFSQVWNRVAGDIDLDRVREELAVLRAAMEERATEPEQHVAIGNVAAAEKAAGAGDGPKTMRFLKAAGAWALDVAAQVGAGTAVTAIQEALKAG